MKLFLHESVCNGRVERDVGSQDAHSENSLSRLLSPKATSKKT